MKGNGDNASSEKALVSELPKLTGPNLFCSLLSAKHLAND
jgi:hypothetical protein